MSVSSKLITINTAKTNIKEAIESMGISLTGTPFTDYHNKIYQIGTSPVIFAVESAASSSVKNRIVKIDSNSGNILASYTSINNGDYYLTEMFTSDKYVYVFNKNTEKLERFTKELTGKISSDTTLSATLSSVVVDRDQIYYGSRSSGNSYLFAKLNISLETLYSTTKTSTTYIYPIGLDESVIYSQYGNSLRQANKGDGSVVSGTSNINFSSNIQSSTSDGEFLYVGRANGSVSKMNLKTSTITHGSGYGYGAINSIYIINDELFALSNSRLIKVNKNTLSLISSVAVNTVGHSVYGDKIYIPISSSPYGIDVYISATLSKEKTINSGTNYYITSTTSG